VLAKALDPDAVVLNEAIRNGPVVLQQMPRTTAGSLVGLSGRRARLLGRHGARG
jgi:hypothetical protein